LMIIQEMYDEFHSNAQLADSYRWLTTDDAKDEMRKSVLKFGGENRGHIERKIREVDLAARVHLVAHCKKQGIVPRTLSKCDRRAVATASALNYELCTDEWPMSLVAEQVDCNLLSSLDILFAMETEGSLTAAARRDVVQNWLRLRERLPQNWMTRYKELFGEAPPEA
jgi:hypothetical protein